MDCRMFWVRDWFNLCWWLQELRRKNPMKSHHIHKWDRSVPITDLSSAVKHIFPHQLISCPPYLCKASPCDSFHPAASSHASDSRVRSVQTSGCPGRRSSAVCHPVGIPFKNQQTSGGLNQKKRRLNQRKYGFNQQTYAKNGVFSTSLSNKTDFGWCTPWKRWVGQWRPSAHVMGTTRDLSIM